MPSMNSLMKSFVALGDRFELIFPFLVILFISLLRFLRKMSTSSKHNVKERKPNEADVPHVAPMSFPQDPIQEDPPSGEKHTWYESPISSEKEEVDLPRDSDFVGPSPPPQERVLATQGKWPSLGQGFVARTGLSPAQKGLIWYEILSPPLSERRP